MKNWLRKVIRKWLGVEKIQTELRINERQICSVQRGIIRLNDLTKNLVTMGVDVHFTTPSMILVYSRIKGGQIREIRADFETMRDLADFVEEMKQRFNTDKVVIDTPFKRF
jgi:hypothetical protein